MKNKVPSPIKTGNRRIESNKLGHHIRAVLFDFDGTLTRPGALDFAAIKQLIDCPPEMAILEYIDTIKEQAEKKRVNGKLDQAEELAALNSKPNDGAEAILDWLKSRGVLIGIITRNALQPVINALENFNHLTLDDFDIVISRENPVQPKPSSEGVEMALQHLNVRPDEALMIGDFLFDMTAGNSAGVTTVLIPAPGEQRNVAEWEQDCRITCLDELVPMIEYHLPLPNGKLPNKFLNEALHTLNLQDPSLLVAPGVGEDTTAIAIDEEEVLVLKSDPITFVSDAAAQYAVTINANDIATSGALPRWFLSTLLFPPGSTPSEILATIAELQDFCRACGMSLCGGHTEITDAVTRPVISGMIAGTVTQKGLVDKKNMTTGDRVLLTKSVSIEGTAILAQEFTEELRQGGLTEAEISDGKQFLEQISILPEASLAAGSSGTTAMHDITEGGVATALEELSQAGNHRLRVDMDRIPIHDLTRRMCAIFDLNPLGLIGSGSLLISCSDSSAELLIKKLRIAGIQVSEIGVVLESGVGIEAVSSGTTVDWPTFSTDELARLFS